MSNLDVDLEMAIVDDKSMGSSFITESDSNWTRSQKVMRNLEFLLLNSTRWLTHLIEHNRNQSDIMVPSSNTIVVDKNASM